jgi:hypothetical protein
MTKHIMDDDIARTAGRILRRGGLTPAEGKRFRTKLRAKAEATRHGGYGVRDEQNLNWFGRAGYPIGGGYSFGAGPANPMGRMSLRFADLRGIHGQTHAAGGYAQAPKRDRAGKVIDFEY